MGSKGALDGIKVIEMAGLAPGPFCGMVLADFGADVVRVDRAPLSAGDGGGPLREGLTRGKRSIAVNLKDPGGLELLLDLLDGADVLIDPFRPGVLERRGLGPDVVHARNPRLVFARMTGWGQTGTYAPMAGHDINYVALSGALSIIGRKGEKPVPPVNLLGDFAGGGMMCAMGIVLALLERERSGEGQVVDAAMVDGATYLSTFIYGFARFGAWNERGTNMLDTGAHFYDTYETKDGKYMSVGSIEPQFYALLVNGLDVDADALANQMDQGTWEEGKKILADAFKTKTRDEWCAVFDGTDACVAPVLELGEVGEHPHNKERGLMVDPGGRGPLPAPAPRLSRTPPEARGTFSTEGQDTRAVLAEYGIAGDRVEALLDAGAIAEGG